MDDVLGHWFEYCPSNALLSSLPDMNDSFDRWHCIIAGRESHLHLSENVDRLKQIF